MFGFGMGNDRIGCLALRDAIERHLNIIVITWLDENNEMFESLPINPPILHSSHNEQEYIIARLENYTTHTNEDEDSPVDD